MIARLIDYLQQRSKGVKQVCYGGIALIIVWSAIATDSHHVHTWVERIPGFWALFGLASTVVLIYFANWLGKSGIQTREDYYDN
ncbi:MAG: hypothetical protein ACK5PS_11400 [Desulfopila sp.]